VRGYVSRQTEPATAWFSATPRDLAVLEFAYGLRPGAEAITYRITRSATHLGRPAHDRAHMDKTPKVGGVTCALKHWQSAVFAPLPYRDRGRRAYSVTLVFLPFAYGRIHDVMAVDQSYRSGTLNSEIGAARNDRGSTNRQKQTLAGPERSPRPTHDGR
jgi:hypothetical protein